MQNIQNKEIKKYIKKEILGNERGHSEVVAETIVKSKNENNMYRKLNYIKARLNADPNCPGKCDEFITILNNLIDAQRARIS
jgi:hypothetical protein